MTKRTKVLLFVFLVSALTAVISFFKSGDWNLSTILQAGLIAAILNIILLLYDHYGWRMFLFKYAATSPNL